MAKELSLIYPAKFTSEKEGGYTVTFRNLENVFSEGNTYEETLFNAQEALDILLLDMTQDDLAIPTPSRIAEDEVGIAVSSEVATPVLLHTARKEKQYTMTEVARSMGKGSNQSVGTHFNTRGKST